MCSNLAYFKQPPCILLTVQINSNNTSNCQNSEAMSTRRTRAQAPTNKVDELNDLVLKLQMLLPNSSSRSQEPAPRVIKETCNYIKRLQREADDLSEKLSQILSSLENNGVDVGILRNLLQQ